MSKRGTTERDNGELEYTRAAWDAARDAEKLYGLEFVSILDFDSVRGVMRLAVAFWDVDVSACDLQPIRVEMTWPNANGASWGAFFFQQTTKACQMAAAWHESKRRDASEGGA